MKHVRLLLLLIPHLFFSDDAGERRVDAHANEGRQLADDETKKRLTVTRLEFENLNEVRRDLESKIAKMQARIDRSMLLLYLCVKHAYSV